MKTRNKVLLGLLGTAGAGTLAWQGKRAGRALFDYLHSQPPPVHGADTYASGARHFAEGDLSAAKSLDKRAKQAHNLVRYMKQTEQGDPEDLAPHVPYKDFFVNAQNAAPASLPQAPGWTADDIRFVDNTYDPHKLSSADRTAVSDTAHEAGAGVNQIAAMQQQMDTIRAEAGRQALMRQVIEGQHVLNNGTGGAGILANIEQGPPTPGLYSGGWVNRYADGGEGEAQPYDWTGAARRAAQYGEEEDTPAFAAGGQMPPMAQQQAQLAQQQQSQIYQQALTRDLMDEGMHRGGMDYRSRMMLETYSGQPTVSPSGVEDPTGGINWEWDPQQQMKQQQIDQAIKSNIPYYQQAYNKLAYRAGNPKGAMRRVIPPKMR